MSSPTMSVCNLRLSVKFRATGAYIHLKRRDAAADAGVLLKVVEPTYSNNIPKLKPYPDTL